jgi:type I restriction enzyme, S subunit
MSDSRRQFTLGDLLRIKHGFAFKGEHFSDKGDYVLLTPGNFEPAGGLKLKGEKEKYYTSDFPPEYLLRRGDMLLAMTDLTQSARILGSPGIVPESGRFLHNQRLGKIVKHNDSLVDRQFLYHLFNDRSVREQIKASATGATVRHTAPERIYAVKVSLPNLHAQRRIASILSAYDDLIENNTRRIAILEEMARRTYEEWFVRFRFPGHKNVRMVESELGLVPEGWPVLAASAAIHINPQTKVAKDGLKPFVAMNCLADGSMLVGAPEQRSGNSGSKFRNGDTLFARITPCLENGKTGFVQFLPDDESVAFGSTEFIVLRSRNVTPEFVYLLARSTPFRDNAIKSMSGASGRQRVRDACFDTFLLPQPDPATLRSFTEKVRPMFKLIHALTMKNRNLGTTRDLLLPKLISGEMDVSAMPEPEAATA